MQVHLVFESLFGNSRDIAGAIAAGYRGARPDDTFTLVNVLHAPTDPDADLLIVGGPTHEFSMSRPTSRAQRDRHVTTDAVRAMVAELPDADTGPGIREWLDALTPARPTLAAAFDTRATSSLPMPRRAGKAMSKRLTALGYRMAVPPTGFLVGGVTGPLVDGELERARAWGAELAGAVGG